MTRSIWKGPFVHPSLLKKIDKLKDTPNKKPIKTWSRNSTIIPDFVGHSFMIHNGKSFIPITISEEMVGHKLGCTKGPFQTDLVIIFCSFFLL